MERKFYTDNFEQLLKEKSDEFRMYPSKRVWHSIYNDLHPGRKWPSIAVSMLLIISLLMVSYWNSNNATAKTAIAANVVLPKTATAIITPQQNIFLGAGNNQNLLPAPVANNSNTNAQAGYKNLNNSSINPSSVTNSKTSIPFAAIDAANKLNGKNGYAFVKEKNITQQSGNFVKANLAQQKDNDATNTAALDLIEKNNSEEITRGNIDNNIQIKTETTYPNISITENTASNTGNLATENNKEDKTLKTGLVTAIKTISADDKAWMEAYAFNNKPKRKKWKDRTAAEFYITPSVGYRILSNNTTYNAAISNPLILAANNAGNLNNELNNKPGLGLEAGIGLVYSLAKNIRVKAGVQANYTNYVINADETDHPIVTTLLFNNLINGYPYMEARSSTLANNTGFKTVKAHNKTYQISIPVGLAVKLTGNQKLEWYAGATIQPTFVIGGKANLISSDRRNYVSDPSLIRRWGLNSGFETYIHYKFAGYTLQAGPQFRYQLVSTYSQKYSLKENLYNAGLKIGVIKNL